MQRELLLAVCLATGLPALGRDDVAWNPKAITCKVVYATKYRDFGKHLDLKQKLPHGTTGWTQSKLDVPDRWQIQETYFQGDSLIIQLSDFDKFYLSPVNWRVLHQKLINLKPRDDDQVHEIWETHGRVAP